MSAGKQLKSIPKETGAKAPTLSIEEKIKQVFKDDAETAIKVARAESHFNPKAHNENKNGTYDTGIFQINSIHGYEKEWLENPDNNILAAYEIYQKAGNSFTPWSTFNWAIAHRTEI